MYEAVRRVRTLPGWDVTDYSLHFVRLSVGVNKERHCMYSEVSLPNNKIQGKGSNQIPVSVADPEQCTPVCLDLKSEDRSVLRSFPSVLHYASLLRTICCIIAARSRPGSNRFPMRLSSPNKRIVIYS